MASRVADRRPQRVWAAILFWHARELPLVAACVESLLAQQLGGVDLQVLVIDNGSGLTPRLPDGVELLRLPANLGFAGGHNAGMRLALAAGAEFVFLVNSDVVVDGACLQTLLEAAAAWPTAGILGPLVLSAASASQTAQAGQRVESAGQTFNRGTGRHREIARGRAASEVDPQPHRVDAVSGCALLARRVLAERVGLLDERLYLYFEDMDWCLRARQAGFEVGVVPGARVWHRGSGSTRPGWPGTTFYSVRNHLVLGARYARGPLARGVLPPLILAYHLAFLARSRLHRTPSHLRALLHGAVAAWTSQMGEQGRHASWH